jgi:IclR family transcriptional regulator, pca regulon regulatory protein
MLKTEPLASRDWIAGLDKGLRILEAFNDVLPRMTPTQAAHCTGLSRTAARRYLLTLQELGYVASDGKTFWLAPRVLRVGWGYFDTARLPRTVLPYLQRVTGLLNEVALCGVLDGDDVVYIARNGANRVHNVGFVLGARANASLTSAGIAILSCRPPDDVDRWLHGRTFRPHTPFTLTTEAEIRMAINQARASGFAMLEQQLEPGVRGVAVPLRNRYGDVVAGLSVSLTLGKEPRELAIARVVPTLKEVAHSLLNLL